MRLMERIGKALGFGQSGGDANVGSYFAKAGTWEKPPSRTVRELLKAYDTSPWLRAVVGRIGDSLSSTEWILTREKGKPRKEAQRVLRTAKFGTTIKRHEALKKAVEGGDLEEIDQHEILDRLRNPNPLLQGPMLWRMAAAYLDLSNELWLLKEFNGGLRDKKAVPDALWPVPPTWITKRPSPADLTFKVSIGGLEKTLPLTAAVWAINASPGDPYGRGNSIASALAGDLDVDEYATNYMRSFFFNNALPPILITGDGIGRTDDDVKRLEAAFESRSGSFWKRFKPFFMSKNVEVHNLGQTLASLGVEGLRQWERDVIVQVWGFPPEALGIIENSNRATIEAAEYLLARLVLVPRLELLRTIFQGQLVAPVEDGLVMDFVSPVQEDREFRLRAMAAQPHAFLVDEHRGTAGLDPLPGGQGRVHVFASPQVLVVPEGGLLDMADDGEEEMPTDDELGRVPPQPEEEPDEEEPEESDVLEDEGEEEL